MKNVVFSKNGEEVEVLVDGETYGKIKRDNDQNVWVLWQADIDDGVSYWDDLQETEDQIAFEIQHPEN